MINTALDEVVAARSQRDHFDRELRVEIAFAFNNRDGFTVDDIAEAAGLSRARIYQIAEEEKAK